MRVILTLTKHMDLKNIGENMGLLIKLEFI